MKNSKQKISVIIPSLNRAADLAETLKSIFSQKILPDEIIIVDQSLDYKAESTVKKLYDEFKSIANNNTELIYIHDSLITGSAQARNIGIHKATGDIVYFFDDDVILEEEYIRNTQNIYQWHSDISMVGGVLTNYSGYRGITGLNKLFDSIFTQGPIKDERLKIYLSQDKVSLDKLFKTRKLTGCAMSVRKTILDEYKFDEGFRGYSFGEDVDFSYRISRKNRIVISPLVRLYHKSLGPKDDDEIHISRQIHFWRYFVRKNLKDDILANCALVWFCLGIAIKGILLFWKNPGVLKGVISGLTKKRKTENA